MVNLAHALDEVAVIFKVLAEGDHVGQSDAEVCLQVPDLIRIGPSASQNTGARGRTDRLLAVRPLKGDAGFSETIEVGALDVVSAISAEFRPQIIDGDEQNIGANRRGVRGMNEAGRHEREDQVQERFHDDKILSFREREINSSAVLFLFTGIK